jgi:hypothetical protein
MVGASARSADTMMSDRDDTGPASVVDSVAVAIRAPLNATSMPVTVELPSLKVPSSVTSRPFASG